MNLYRPRATQVPLPRIGPTGCPEAHPGDSDARAQESLASWHRALGCETPEP